MSNKELIKQLKDKERETQNQLTKLLIYKASDEVKAEKRGERNAYREAIILAKKLKQPQLNENQQIVLEYLKTQFGKHEIFVKSIFDPIQELLIDYWDDEVDTAFAQLDLKQEIQVLEVFSDWALEQEEGNE